MNLRALLVDGDATLFAERLTLPDYALRGSARLLASQLPELDREELRNLLEGLWRSQQETERAGIQPGDALTADLLDTARPGLGAKAARVRHALAREGWQPRQPFPGAVEMLATAQRLQLATVLVSNTAWLCEEDYWQVMEEMGLADHLDYLVSSFDTGARKPHRVLFDRAIERVGCSFHECVMVGDSESNDIEPAAQLGIRTIRVTMQHPVKGKSGADAVADSLDQATEQFQRWAAELRGSAGALQASQPDQSMVERRRLVNAFVAYASEWAARRSDVTALGLAGSWARGTARPTSDVDLLLLTTDPELYTARSDWSAELGAVAVIRKRRWGAITERRLRLSAGLEVEVGIALPSWASVDPLDPGTSQVVGESFRILHDPHGCLAALVAACLR
jgi:FMN phosphatase YigB (HAD superfamily)/predicted nucleotidyltransferase